MGRPIAPRSRSADSAVVWIGATASVEEDDRPHIYGGVGSGVGVWRQVRVLSGPDPPENSEGLPAEPVAVAVMTRLRKKLLIAKENERVPVGPVVTLRESMKEFPSPKKDASPVGLAKNSILYASLNRALRSVPVTLVVLLSMTLAVSKSGRWSSVGPARPISIPNPTFSSIVFSLIVFPEPAEGSSEPPPRY